MKEYKNTTTRFEPLLPFIKGDVLDCCCCGMGENDVMGGVDFMHGQLKKLKPNIILEGVDINKKSVEKMNNNGYYIHRRDVQESFDLKKKYDTIICEEGIEHLDDQKTFLENVRNHMKPDGLFLLTTPNIASFQVFMGVVLHGQPRKNPYHTHYHIMDSITYLLERNGFKIMHSGFFTPINLKATNLNARILKMITPFLPARFGKQIYVIAKVKR